MQQDREGAESCPEKFALLNSESSTMTQKMSCEKVLDIQQKPCCSQSMGSLGMASG